MSAVVDNPFGSSKIAERPGVAAASEIHRSVSEMQAMMLVAKKFPRNQMEATDRILQACTRPSLAEQALYSYNRGGTDITGPSIRLAEMLAQNWGNIDFGIKELAQEGGASEVMAYCWDTETNARQVKVFKVPHTRFRKAEKGGPVRLEDPRDIYELVANNGARRLRACILGVIPGDVIDAAVDQCEKTLTAKVDVTPDLIKEMLAKFADYGVTKEMVEKRIQRHIESISPASVVQLRKIFNSLKDGMSTIGDWFEAAPATGVEDDGKPKTGAAALKAAAAAGKDKNVAAAQVPAQPPSGEPNGVQHPQPAPAAATTVSDAIAGLAKYNDPELMALWADAELSAEVKADERFTKQYKRRLDEIKGKK